MKENVSNRPGMKLLVVGCPRSGFSLLISVLNSILPYYYKYKESAEEDPMREELKTFIPQASERVYGAIEDYFRKHINLDDLIISPEFKLLVGGPKWLSKEDKNMACVRKYIGIKDMGDFLLIISIPKVAMDYHDVVHSHYEPQVWLEDTYYKDYLKFSSIRNPIDILHSSVLSINAMTSEYIQRYVSEDSNVIRDKLALYKLTDLNFFEGLISPLREYLKKFIEVKDNYFVMKWEDLITKPEETIKTIAKWVDIPITERAPGIIWDKMSHRNLLQYHKHNFRKGVIGDWKNRLVNEHLDILKGHGFDEFLEVLGYGKIQYLDSKNYTPYQKKVEEYISNGKVYEWDGDKNIFTFAFNKSNFRSSKFEFVEVFGKEGARIERATIKDEAFLKGLIDAVEEVLMPVNESLKEIWRRYGYGIPA